MAVSDDLTKLAARAKEAEDHAAAAQTKAKADLETDVAAVKEDISDRRAEHDVDRASKRAENAEDDAAFAIQYAVAAIGEAEYAVLDASLARMDADELAATTT